MQAWPQQQQRPQQGPQGLQYPAGGPLQGNRAGAVARSTPLPGSSRPAGPSSIAQVRSNSQPGQTAAPRVGASMATTSGYTSTLGSTPPQCLPQRAGPSYLPFASNPGDLSPARAGFNRVPMNHQFGGQGRSPQKPVASPGSGATPLTSDTRSSTGCAPSPADSLPSGRRQGGPPAWEPPSAEKSKGLASHLFPETPPSRSSAASALAGANAGAMNQRVNDMSRGQAPRAAIGRRGELSPARDPQGQSGSHHKHPPQVVQQGGGCAATPQLQNILGDLSRKDAQAARAPQAVVKSRSWEVEANKVRTVEDAPVLQCRQLAADGNQGQSSTNVTEDQGFDQAVALLGSLAGNKEKIMKGFGLVISRNMARDVPDVVTQSTVTLFTQGILDTHYYDLIHVVMAWNYLKRYCIKIYRMKDGEATFNSDWKREVLTALHLADSSHPLEKDESLKDTSVRKGAEGWLGDEGDGKLWAFSADMCRILDWKLVVWIEPKVHAEDQEDTKKLATRTEEAKKNNQEFNQSTFELTSAVAQKEVRGLSVRGQSRGGGQHRSPSSGGVMQTSKSSPVNLSNEAAREAAREGSQTRQAPVAPDVEDRPEEKQSTMEATRRTPLTAAPVAGAGPANKGTRATMPAATNRQIPDKQLIGQPRTMQQPPAPLHRSAAPAPQASANRDATSAPASGRPDAIARGPQSARAFPYRATSTGGFSSRSNVGSPSGGALASSRSNPSSNLGSPLGNGALASSRSNVAGGPPPRTMPQTTPRVGAAQIGGAQVSRGLPNSSVGLASPTAGRVLPQSLAGRSQLAMSRPNL